LTILGDELIHAFLHNNALQRAMEALAMRAAARE
jgi:hypothetical protein